MNAKKPKVVKKKVSKKKPVNRLKQVVDEYMSRIDAGVEFLDSTLGRRNWLSKLNESQLDLESGHVCVLGQAYGNFWKSVIRPDGESAHVPQAGLTEEEAAEYGFYLDDDIPGYEQEPHGLGGYDILTHLWHCRIVALKVEEGMALAEIE